MSEQVQDFSKMTMTLEQLGISTAPEDLAIIPSGGEDFGAGNLIGLWDAKIMQWFLTDGDYVMYNRAAKEDGEPLCPGPDLRRLSSDYYNMYYQDYETADTAYALLCPESKEAGFKIETHWTFVGPVETILNVTNKDKFRERGDPAIRDVRITGLSVGRGAYPLHDRHLYSLIALPAAVAAVANIRGYDNVGYDLSELSDPDAKDSFNEEFTISYVGDIRGGYKDSVLYKRRTALWASLGEGDPEKNTVMGSKTAKGKPHPKATTSGKLSECISIAQGKLSGPLWLRLTGFANPVMDKKKGEYYNNAFAITEIFFNETHARQVAAEELAERGVGDGTDVLAGAPPLPEDWREAGSHPLEFIGHLHKYDGQKVADIVSEVSATLPEIIAWRAFILEKGL